ncbi:MAG TPA: hypothetical protein VH143_27775 [Kofleriaceae bacterium]|nr:hypothetical protein [Kofleriaceae bacterium]
MTGIGPNVVHAPASALMVMAASALMLAQHASDAPWDAGQLAKLDATASSPATAGATGQCPKVPVQVSEIRRLLSGIEHVLVTEHDELEQPLGQHRDPPVPYARSRLRVRGVHRSRDDHVDHVGGDRM